jgi:hypothetical protein
MTQNSHPGIYEDPQFNISLFAREPGDPPPNGGDEPTDEGDPPPNGGEGDPPPNGG